MLERVELGIDGNMGYALLGENLQSGEVEFFIVEQRAGEFLYEAETRAAWTAFNNLKKRLQMPGLSYAWWPRRPGSAGA